MPLGSLLKQLFRFDLGSSPHQNRLALLGLVFGVLYWSGPACGQSGQLDESTHRRYQEILKTSDIDPTPTGIGLYLNELHPNAETKTRLQSLITLLGHDDFFKREDAMKQLLRLPVHSPELFQKALDAGDPEVGWRVRQVIKQGNQRTERLLHAAFSLIRHEKMPDLVKPMLAAIPFCTEGYIQEEALRSIKTIATKDEVPMIEAALKKSHPQSQRIAMITLEHLLGAKADSQLQPFLSHKQPLLKYTSAKSMGNHGNREALSALVELLDSEDLQIRSQSAQTLRLMTGQNFSYVAYDKSDKRAEAHDRWEKWLAANQQTAKLTFPIPDGPILRGHTLISNYSTKKVIELDANHKEVWSETLNGAWGCEGLPNGHRLVTSYSGRAVYEYDLNGKIIWKKETLPGLPYSVQRLQNGNTLVTCSNNQVIEYTPKGEIAWQHRFNGTARDAQRLANGNTMVVLYSTQQVVEVDRQGKQVWELKNLNRPMCAQRLENGNTLVCQSAGQRLVEADRKGNIVWNLNVNLSIYDAQRLHNGNTLVVGSTGAIEYDPKGKEIWRLNQPGMRGIHRF